MMKFWKALLRSAPVIPSSTESAQHIAKSHGLYRRRFLRVDLPDSSPQCLPRLAFKGADLPIVNISVGGACTRDPFNHILPLLGQETQIEMSWPGKRETIDVRVVGVSKHVHRHFEFLGLSPDATVILAKLVQAGNHGKSFRPTADENFQQVRLNVAELWVSPTGENLLFHDSGDYSASLTIDDREWSFPKFRVPQCVNTDQTASLDDLAGLIVLLSNIPRPSLRIRQLRMSLETLAQPLLKAGTDE